jgi:hypothetical protein
MVSEDLDFNCIPCCEKYTFWCILHNRESVGLVSAVQRCKASVRGHLKLSNQGNIILRLDAVPPTVARSCVLSDLQNAVYNPPHLDAFPTIHLNAPQDVLC